MQGGAILYVEEINRAPSGALNALLTALSEGYLEVPRLGRIEARPGFMLAGGANPLDDVGTSRLSRGLLDRFIVVELDYQSREEEIEIVRRNTDGRRLPRLQDFAVDLGRATRTHPELRHGASVRAAIDFVLLAAEHLEGGAAPDRADLQWLACAAYAGKVRVRPPASKSACAIIVELFDDILVKSFGGGLEILLDRAAGGVPADADAPQDGSVAEDGEAGRAEGGERKHVEGRDEVPGRARPGGGGEPGRSRSVPMTGRDRAPAGGELSGPPQRVATEPLADFNEEDVEAVIERILRLPEGKATDLSRALAAAAEFAEQQREPTEVILISDCMPTRGMTSFGALQSAARAVPSLHICYMDEQLPAIRLFDQSGSLDLYEWWARRWVGDERVYKMRSEDDTNLVIDGLSARRETGL